MAMMLVSVLLLAVCLPSALGAGLQGSDCDLNNIPVMTNFDPSRYQGVWYPTHDYRLSPYLFDVSSLKYEMTYDDAFDAVTAKVSMVMDDETCYEDQPVYQVEGGVLSSRVTSRNGETVREDKMTVLHTDYTSVLLFLYEVFENGERNEDSSNLSLMVRDPSRPPNFPAVAAALSSFCGEDADSIDFLEPLDFDWTATCDA